MTSRSLTMSDLLAISGYTRDQMRGLLESMPAYASRNSQVRVARQYTAQDLLVVRTCSQLESRYGLQRSAVASFSDTLRSVLSGPRPLLSMARLLFTFEPINVRYVEATEAIEEGLLIPLVPIFHAVDEYLLPGHSKLNWGQQELGFGLQPINSATAVQNPVMAGKLEQTRRTL